jgi:hypothetical protein
MRFVGVALAGVVLVVSIGFGTGCGKRQEAGAASDGKPKPIAPGDAPTEADCTEALARMRTIIPEGVYGDAMDRADCMAMPRSVVVCLHGVTSENEADACVASYEAARRAAGPPPPVVEETTAVGPPPDEQPRIPEADCRAAVTNARRLVPDNPGNDEEMIRDCTQQAVHEEVRCVAKAKTREELEACEPQPEPPP